MAKVDATLDVRCPRCNAAVYYTRLKDKTHVCRRCGHQWKVSEEARTVMGSIRDKLATCVIT